MDSRVQVRPSAAALPQSVVGTRPWPLETASDSALSRRIPFIVKILTINFPEFFEERILCFSSCFVSGYFCQDPEALDHGILFWPRQHRRR